MNIQTAIDAINREYKRAIKKYPSFHSNHEGYAVIKEEVDELWDEIKKCKGIRKNEPMEKELIQVAAMCLRFLTDL